MSVDHDPGEWMQGLHARQPRFRDAVIEDAKVTAAYRGERHEFRSWGDAIAQVLRLMWATDAFAAQVFYRAKASLRARGIPVLPRIAHRMAIALGQISIGDPVLVHPGVYLIHGRVVIDGIVEIQSQVTIAPWVTIGLRAGSFQGPTICSRVQIGSGAKVIGPVTVGAGASIGANAVVVDDVPAEITVVGVPARAAGAPSGD